MKPILSHCLSTLAILTAGSTAATLAEYRFDTASPQSIAESSKPTSFDPSVTAGSVAGTQFQVSPSSGSAFLRHNLSSANAPANAGPASLSDAISRENTYIEFTITPTVAGLDLTAFRFNHSTSRLTISTEPNVYPDNFLSGLAVFASLDGFASTPVAGDALFISEGNTTGTSTNLGNKDFALTGFENLTPSDTVTFRVYAYGTGDHFQQITRIDNISIEGIPEPSSVVLLGMAASIISLRRRKS